VEDLNLAIERPRISPLRVAVHKDEDLRAADSVANFCQIISAKSTEKFGRWRKNSASHNILLLKLFYKDFCRKEVTKKLNS
jgi:hypothetical protein